MSRLSARTGFRTLRAIAMIGAMVALNTNIATAADDITSDQIQRALAPTAKPLTRGLSMTPPTAEPDVKSSEGKFVESLRNRSTRSLSIGEREQIAAVAQTRPAIDLEINFDYNSATISRKSQSSVQALGKALSSDALKGSTFVLAGHTDAVGSDAYNQDLSERRSDAIKRYLVDQFGIAAAELVTVGYGESKPKPNTAPTDPINRRVQVVNMAGNATASR